MLDEPTALKVKTRGCPLGSAALTQVSLRGFWSSSLIDSQKKAGFYPLDKLHTSVSYPYVLLDADEHGYRIQLRRVDYDREAVIKAIEHSRHPNPTFLMGFMRGERVSSSDPGFFQAGRRAKNQKEQ